MYNMMNSINSTRFFVCVIALISIGILDVLVVIAKEYDNNVDIMSLVLKVLANLSCDPSAAQPIKDSGKIFLHKYCDIHIGFC